MAPARFQFSAAAAFLAALPALLAGLAAGFPLQPLGSQAPAETRLRPPTARLDEEFNRIVGLRELGDGRVLVADAGDKRLVVVDFARNQAAQIGREGNGPGEYAQVALLASLGPDSTLMPDAFNRRWLVLIGDRIARTIPPGDPAVTASRGVVRSTDERGHGVSVTPPPIRSGGQAMGKSDSIAVLLVTLSSGATDTVARLRTAPLTVWTELDNAGKVTRAGLTYPPFSVGEESLLFPDGWLAVARLDPYRVDWRTPEGRWISGAPLPFMQQPVDTRERQAYLARRTALVGRPATAPPDEAWPATIPPFQPFPLVAVPDGGLLILRTPTAGHPGHRYDRIDRRGQLIGWVELPAAERLMAIGARGAYVVSTDEDGIQRLRRHPWP
ncbi:MAG TPA: hypothetical protein VJ817_01890 [Gemmatimonadales bacterium]|nr:hypothetical protein [Gemmatimonadales bacterium]